MKAMRLGDPQLLPPKFLTDEATPQPGAGEALIRVVAAGVTPTELQWYPTTHTVSGKQRVGAIPGHEFSGIVAAMGAGAQGFSVGQAVYGMNDWFADGATAEFCLTQPKWIAAKPARLTHAQAASVPIGALTAHQALFDRAGLQRGQRVLIHGGAGAVGVFAVQMAAQRGAHVIVTASASARDFLVQLGAAETIDYRTEPFERRIDPVDVVFDTVGGDTLAGSWDVLKPGGRLVTIAAGQEAADQRSKDAFFIVEPRSDELLAIGEQLESGALLTEVDCVVGFEQAADAYANAIPRRHRGKVVVAIGPELQ